MIENDNTLQVCRGGGDFKVSVSVRVCVGGCSAGLEKIILFRSDVIVRNEKWKIVVESCD